MTDRSEPRWVPDVLGVGYEATTLPLRAVNGETPVATLVRHRPGAPRGTAVLYLHGYNDYFFQRELAGWFAARGQSFFALELRRYGRSLLPGQVPGYTQDLREYDEELDLAVRTILAEGHDRLLLVGHSTGGLVLPLWAARRRELPVAGMILNSPFFEFRQSPAVRAVAGPAFGLLARTRPLQAIPAGVDTAYGDSLHVGRFGEWDYDLAWKPSPGWPARAGWVAAIIAGHRLVHAGLGLRWPVLVLASDTAVGPKAGPTALRQGDAVLDPDSIAQWAPAVGSHVTVVRVEGGMHDLVLSPRPVRDRVYDVMGDWLAAWSGEPIRLR